MAVASSSLSTTFSLLSLPSNSPKPNYALSFSLLNSKPLLSIRSHSKGSRIFAAPEAMETQQTLEPPSETLDAGFQVRSLLTSHFRPIVHFAILFECNFTIWLQGSEIGEASPLSVGSDAEKVLLYRKLPWECEIG